MFVRDFFYGYLTSKEAEILLLKQPIGTFLMRLSKSNMGSFAVSFVYGPQQIGHVLIATVPEGHILADAKQQIQFASLEDVIDYYRDALTNPYNTQLALQKYVLLR